MRKLLGYILFGYSWIGWLAIATLPFLGLPISLVASIGAVLLISSEIAFVASLALLGPEFWNKIKAFFSKSKRRNTDSIDIDH